MVCGESLGHDRQLSYDGNKRNSESKARRLEISNCCRFVRRFTLQSLTSKSIVLENCSWSPWNCLRLCRKDKSESEWSEPAITVVETSQSATVLSHVSFAFRTIVVCTPKALMSCFMLLLPEDFLKEKPS